tara:strand:+ start:10784 stop:11239 length:456 start_codon:yes stop_codon:yes gene_type:complete
MEIQNYPNYLIYEDGKIYSKYKKRFLKVFDNGDGYKIIQLSCNKKLKGFKIHRLLAQHFIPNPDKKEFVDHINRIRDDNRLENLRWCTKSENCVNIKMRKDNKSGLRNIIPRFNGYCIEIQRNKLIYNKYKKSLDEAIKQRDLMLSMFIFK